MEKILKMPEYTLIFSEPDVILYSHIDGNLCVYQDEAEEFAKSFFSKDIMGTKYINSRNLSRAKQWLEGILYHERNNSIPEVMELTGYKGRPSVYRAVKKFGPTRSIKEGVEIAFQKRYGKSNSEVMSEKMQKKWDEDKNGKFRDKIRSTASKGMKRYWKEKRKHS